MANTVFLHLFIFVEPFIEKHLLSIERFTYKPYVSFWYNIIAKFLFGISLSLYYTKHDKRRITSLIISVIINLIFTVFCIGRNLLIPQLSLVLLGANSISILMKLFARNN